MDRTAFVDAGPSAYPIAAAYDGSVFLHEKGRSADGAAFSWFIETADSYLDPETTLLVRGLWPDFKDQVGPVTVTASGRLRPQGVETASQSVAMAPSDAKADLLLSGRLFKLRFSGASAPTGCRIGQPTFDAAPAGQL
jgi:hypothetical protein